MALLAPLHASTLPFDLTGEAVEQFPKALALARSIQEDMASLEPVRIYLQHKNELSEELAAAAINDYLKYLILS